MEHKILVAYGTKYGSTAEIAERIGQVLQQAGLGAEVKPAEQVDSLEDYTAVVLGSAVYAGQWRKEAAEFLTTNETALAERPLWLFSSGPTGEGDPVELMNGWRFPEALQPVADRLNARDIAFFGGALYPDKMNLAERLLVKSLKAPTGDFRDWAEIQAWAEQIAAALEQ
jgi:menaquinone-dependent protoporphyrinogen oxidase